MITTSSNNSTLQVAMNISTEPSTSDANKASLQNSSQSDSADSIYTDEEISTQKIRNQEEIDFSALENLHVVDLSHNLFYDFPPSLCQAKKLTKLNLSKNKIRYIMLYNIYYLLEGLKVEPRKLNLKTCL